MCRKILCLVSFVLVLGLGATGVAEAADPSLVGWWKLDETSGTTASDSSGNGHPGTLQANPQWVEGWIDGALQFNGNNYVDTGYTENLAKWTLAAWVISPAAPSSVSPSGPVHREMNYQFNWNHTDANFRGAAALCVGGTWYAASYMPLEANTWYHLAATYDGEVFKAYRNGVLITTNLTPTGNPDAEGNSLKFGRHAGAAQYFTGTVDDVRVYNRALTDAEIKQLIPPQYNAYSPDPKNGATGVIIGLVTWKAGVTAALHDVYFGTNPTPGPAEYIGRTNQLFSWFGTLPPGTTYYWRIDEVEADGTIRTGKVWSFTATPLTAWDPKPPNGATNVLPAVQLSWSAGQNATKHHLYFGDSFSDVDSGAGGTDKGELALAVTTYNTGPLYPETTYYWRVDENDGTTSRKGDIWSFATPAGGSGIMREWWLNIGAGTTIPDLTGNANYPDNPTARETLDIFEGPVDWANNYGSRLYGWLMPPESGDYTFWIATDDPGQLWLSTDADPANKVMIASVSGWTNSREWEKYPAQKSLAISLVKGKAYYIEALMKEGGGGDNIAVAWQGGPITSRQIISGGYVSLAPFAPIKAYGATPADKATDVTDTVTLRWMAGEKAAKHNVYFGTDATAVENATTASTGIYRGQQNLDATSYSPTEVPLQWNKTYYWRIDEVNPAEPDGPWKGIVWSFTTANFIVVDDFESYTDDVANRIFQTWKDGIGYTNPPPGYPGGNGTGSAVGNNLPPYAEQTIVHGGGQSMPLAYDNSGATGKARYSETFREWTSPQNWTRNNVKALTLYFYGALANAAEQLYVALEDNAGHVKVVNYPDPEAVRVAGWQEWNIELTQFAGVNLAAVKKMYIGLGNRTSPKVGGTGTIYIDDIRVYPSRCVPSMDKPAASFNDDCVVDSLDLQIMAGDWLVRDVPEPAWSGAFSSQDIGAGTAAGSFSFDGNVYTIQADGADIWGTADAFRYAHKQVSGDFQMTVRVTSLNPVDVWSKAGVMVRQSLDPGSANAMIATSGSSGGGATFQWRPTQGASSSSQRLLESAYAVTEPACIRLVRQGSTISGYVFVGGRWRLEGQTTAVVLTGPVYVGLAVTSHVDGTLTTATFDRACVFSAAELRQDGVIDFKDFAVLADSWLEELLWP